MIPSVDKQFWKLFSSLDIHNNTSIELPHNINDPNYINNNFCDSILRIVTDYNVLSYSTYMFTGYTFFGISIIYLTVRYKYKKISLF